MTKTIIALAQLYKGVLIFRTVDGYVIFNAIGQRIRFATKREAQAYVDGWTLMETYSVN